MENTVENLGKARGMVENIREYAQMPEIRSYEREAMAQALEAARSLPEPERARIMEALEKVAQAGARAARRRHTNADYEGRRRRLVGAQMPIGMADRVRRCAQAQGLSVYAFVMEAVEAACNETDVLLNFR
ncbi:hypothetical protein [Pseudoflavonifractor phocaeensis]|uniref:hypothetical protein n=1 Tax=Pseudoflavonifractor phocaeensis TaxID=1870988 RepID=UPI001956CD68|nr:hypothetical protein [Pseudoflavonifractor phocaeensis]MBM6925783.1 hypothetical protein [Pseudoflavonifractor phocaeensis]